MDARRDRIGEHAALTAPAWAVNALGPVPDDPLDRLDWTERASAIGAYRELYGIDSDTDPIGPEPVNSPEARSAWMAAYGAHLHQDPSGLETPAGQLAAAAPRPVPGRDRVGSAVRRQGTPPGPDGAAGHDSPAGAPRSRSRCRPRPRRPAAADRHAGLAESARAAAEFYASRARSWTSSSKPPARNGPRRPHRCGCRPSRPTPCCAAATRTATGAAHVGRTRAAARLSFPPPALTPPSRHAAMVAERLARFRAEMDSRAGVLIPHEDPDYEPEGEAWPDLGRPRRDAVLQPPRPIMKPPQQRTPERDPEPQA